MSQHTVTVEGGSTVRLKTAGKYCDRNILVTATGGDTDAAYEQGVADGKQAEYDRFWDLYQKNGKRTDYDSAFGRGWNDELFKPKYDMYPKGTTDMFIYSEIADVKGCLEACGVVIDFCSCTTMANQFYYSQIVRLPVIDCSAATRMSFTFASANKLQTVEKLICVETTPFEANTFLNTESLRDLVIEGTIGVSVAFGQSPLSKASLLSVITALSDNVTGQTVTFCKSAVEAAFSANMWATYLVKKPNWTFVLL